MKNKKLIFISIGAVLVLLIGAIAFTSLRENVSITGSWHGTSVTQNGNVIQSNWSGVKFKFRIDGKYLFTNASDYSEEGQYEIKDNMLLTIPENDQTGTSRSVEIIKLKFNLLILRMNDKGNEIILKLERV